MYISSTAEWSETQSVIKPKEGEATHGTNRKTSVSAKKTQEVSVVAEFSKQGLSLAGKSECAKEKSPWEMFLEQREQREAMLARMLLRKKSAGKKRRKSSGDLSRALAIARRIMRGDKVPPKDESFLFRYNSDLYLKAKSMAVINKKPKKHKSLLEDEEESSGVSISNSAEKGECSSGDAGETGDGETSEES